MGRIRHYAFLSFVVLYTFLWCAVLGFSVTFLSSYASTFFSSANLNPQTFVQEITKGLNRLPTAFQGRKNFLFLGVDEIEGRPESSVLTDSMIIASLNFNNDAVTTLSIPRDLWVDQYQTKINAFYQYGKVKYPFEPQRFTKEVVEQITGLPIQHTVVVRLGDLESLINILGGINVNIPRSFEDDLFPREGVDVATVHDPKILYETVKFTQGVEHMDGKRALQFIRSRHSTDLVEGTDESRVIRQQIVIVSILQKMKNKDVIINPNRLGALYQWYNSKYGSDMSVEEMVATAKALYPHIKNFSFHSQEINIRTDGHDGVIYHPVSMSSKQWVYLPVDPTWKGLQDEIHRILD